MMKKNNEEPLAHQPVLLNAVIDGLSINPSGVYVDGTYGRGGHARAILEKLDRDGRLICIDKDKDAIKNAMDLAEIDSRVTVFQSSFANLKKIMEQHQWVGQVDGIVLDLGVSSPQLEDATRGFSFLHDGPLDMRMDSTQGKPLSALLETMKESQLVEIIKNYGEERFAKKIAKAIVLARKTQTLTSTKVLAEVIAKAHPAWQKHRHPATKTFQALRIFVNNELQDIKDVLPQCLDVLKVGARLCVISFHSLEDRIVKKFIQEESKGHNDKSKQWMRIPLRQSELNIRCFCVGRAQKPDTVEINHNPRARSAVLRIVEKTK